MADLTRLLNTPIEKIKLLLKLKAATLLTHTEARAALGLGDSSYTVDGKQVADARVKADALVAGLDADRKGLERILARCTSPDAVDAIENAWTSRHLPNPDVVCITRCGSTWHVHIPDGCDPELFAAAVKAAQDARKRKPEGNA